MKYYDLSRNWTRRIQPHLEDKELNEILVRDFNRFTMGRWEMPFVQGQLPQDFESCDWWCEHRGPIPRYWAYTKHAACHWIVNFSLRLAMLSVPSKPWRIISTQKHSTVWDGADTLFDFNFQAMGISPDDCFKLAGGAKKQSAPGKYIRVHWAENCRVAPR